MSNIASITRSDLSRLWVRAAVWLAFLGPFFFASYGLANWFAAQRSDVGAFVFAWEIHIPFWAWTIVPYWSIDLLYGLSVFFCRTRHELDIHVRRLLTAQIVAVACFLIVPLRFTFERPVAGGLFGMMFDALAGFDKPFNQVPSLHIALLVILWMLYARHTPRRWRWLLHGWFGLIGLSVLTTYQHHFIDIPTGLLLGWFCLWLWPEAHVSPLKLTLISNDPKRVRLGIYYAVAAAVIAAIGIGTGGIALWLLWPAVSLFMVAVFYWVVGEAGFQKGSDGRLALAVRWLLAPYLAAAWLNSRIWTWKHSEPNEIADGVWLGRAPTRRELANGSFKGLVDLTAELAVCPKPNQHYVSVPVLDLTLPSSMQLRSAAEAIERFRHYGPVLVCCALGYSRSAAAVASWLVQYGRYATVDEAVATIRQRRPPVVLDDQLVRTIAASRFENGLIKPRFHS